MGAQVALVSLLLVSMAWAGEVQVKECPFMPNNGQELVVDIEGCETNSVDEYCVVHRGQLVVGIVTFVPFVSSTNLICKINGVFDGDLVFPFPGRCPDPCQHLDSGPNGEYQVCPLVYDITDPKPIKYEIEMEILPEYPLTKVDGEWILYDEHKDTIFCFRVPIEIQP